MVVDARLAKETPVGRRVILAMLGLGGAGVLVGSRIQSWLGRVLGLVQAADPTGLSQLVPAAGRFRIYSITGSLPYRSATSYRLTLDGPVQTPLTPTLDELRAMPATQLVKDFQCVTGWRVPKVPWTGVQLSAVLQAAGI